MKKAYASIFHTLLAVTVLISGMSFTVKKMVCLSSGDVQVGLYSLDGCCGEEEDFCEDSQVEEKCCEYSTQVLDLDKDITIKESSLKQLDLSLLQFSPIYIFSLQVRSQKTPRFSFADLPPPLSGRQLLSFISALVI